MAVIRLHRFHIGTAFRANADVIVDDENLCHQWTQVLRLKTGDALIVLDGAGNEADATIGEVTKKHVKIAIGPVRTVDAKSKREVTLCCAMIRRENFEWVVQKATETGVTRIIPLLTERTVKTGIKIDRLQKIATEAMEQCGRGVLPVIEEPMTLDDALKATHGSHAVFFDFDGDEKWESTLKTEPVSVWIGPEGGWSEAETAWTRTNGCTIASLGSGVLRAETAAAIASYLAGR